MFDYVIASLSLEIVFEIRDLLIRPPTDAPYDNLKAELVKRTAASEQRKLQQLISGEELGDRKPTQLLRRMQQLLGDHLGAMPDNNAFLKELFLQRLPSNVRIVLASADNATDLSPPQRYNRSRQKSRAFPTSSLHSPSTESTTTTAVAVAPRATKVAVHEAPPPRHFPHPTTPKLSAGITPSLLKLPENASSLATGETNRPGTRGDRCQRPSFKSPILRT